MRRPRRRSTWVPVAALLVSMLSAATAVAAEVSTKRGERFHIVPLPRTAGVQTMTNLPTEWAGARQVDAVPFESGSPMCLTGMEDARRGALYAPRSGPVKLGRKVSRFHLLVTTIGSERDGVPLASMVMRNGSDEPVTLRLVFGLHVRNLIPSRDDNEIGNAEPVPALTTTLTGPNRTAMTNRLYHVVLTNPDPAREVESIEWISLFSRATVCVLAMTTEDPELSPPLVGRNRSRLERRASELEDEVYHRELVIEAVDAQTQSPATQAAATLTIFDGDDAFFFGQSRSDVSGNIRLPFPPQHTVTLSAVVRAPGRRPFVYTSPKWAPNAVPGRVLARLETGAPAGGIVQDQSGSPVSNAVIRIRQVRQVSPREYSQLDYEPVTTDAAGRWKTTELPEALSGFQFLVSHPEFRPVLAVADTENPKNGAVAFNPAELMDGRAVIRLPSGLRLTGVVRSASGQPVANAIVRAHAAETLESGSDRGTSTSTGPKGEFLLPMSDTGSFALLVIASNQVPWLQAINVEEPTNRPIEVTLTTPRVMRGSVVDREGQPVPQARVRLNSWNDTRLLSFETETDERGGFVWENPPSGNLRVYVSATDFSSTESSISGDATSARISIQRIPYALASGTVVDAETKQAIEAFSVLHLWRYTNTIDEPIRWRRYREYPGRRGQYSARMRIYLQEQNAFLVSAPGYMPIRSEPFVGTGARTNQFELRRDPGIRGLVIDDSGNPVAGAMVGAVDSTEQMSVSRSGALYRFEGGPLARSDRNGQFDLPPKLEPHTVFASHARGFAQVRFTNLLGAGRIQLKPWARVEVSNQVATTIPERAPELRLVNTFDRYEDNSRESEPLPLNFSAETPTNGFIVFPRVPPGERRLVLEYVTRMRNSSRSTFSHSFPMSLRPGETRAITFGVGGRDVIGRVSIEGGDPDDVDWTRDFHILQLVREPRPAIPEPDMSKPMTEQQRRTLLAERRRREVEYERSPEGRAYERAARYYVLEFQTNGTFRVNGVSPGTYQLSISPTDPSRESSSSLSIGSLTRQVVVPGPSGPAANPPVDLGTLPLTIRGSLRVGKRAPPFSAMDFVGNRVALPDFKGKYVLIHFWATWSPAATAELRSLRSLHENYRQEQRLAFVSVNFDSQPELAKSAIAPLAPAWPQIYAGPWSDANAIQSSYGLRGLPEALLVGPDGVILAMNLRGSLIERAIERALPAASTRPSP